MWSQDQMVSMETLVLHQGFHGKHYSTLGCYFKTCKRATQF